ncbi:TetR/AcrR family transcriptional regulator [Ancylomarina longa]|uniref:TetR/AcrR family transcriptional regulator n=1 Tax=Ancylomarina longa TaxID=2487017 RepID=A0A434AYC3_9BACT|nr:TetR/AcrR family transcriptional regulator [Ancylomarina longa]RUT79572.1 TetR/AcrR family transcriptional regulator [Ancylomarina longa]
MDKKSVETQELIIRAAKKVFAKKGLAGARMQEIADEAGINKAMLHYYYRSKDGLFEHVFQEAVIKLLRPVAAFLADDSELFQKIRNLCRHYYSVLSEYPFLPNFVMNEVNMAPERLLKMMEIEGFVEAKENTVQKINEAIQNGVIRSIDPRDLILNIVSLCVFPFVSKPLTEKLLFAGEDVDELLKNRADRVADFIIASIKLK